MARRFYAAVVASFFDDSGILDTVGGGGSATNAVRSVHNMTGCFLDDKKAQPLAHQRVYLGQQVDVGRVLSQGIVRFDMKPGLREKLADMVDNCFDTNSCTSGMAAKIRGNFGWAATSAHGKCGRGGQSYLLQRQYRDDTDRLTPELSLGLAYLKKLAEVFMPRCIDVLPLKSPCTVIYSDASYNQEDGTGAMGYVAFVPNHPPVGGAATFPPDILEWFQDRKQQIAPCELFLALVVPWNIGKMMQGQDIVWYIDNQSAIATLVRGTSGCIDMSQIAATAHLFFARLHCRVWFEYVQSESNPSDGLSRDGVRDKWTRNQPWALHQAALPESSLFCEHSFASVQRALDHWEKSSLGVVN